MERQAERHYLPLVHGHLKALIEHGTDRYGAVHTPMWSSSLDLNTLSYPADVDPAAGHRVYREIAGPRGSVIYWDVPQIDLAHRVAALTGDASLSRAADDYVRAFLSIAIGAHGLFGFGNHFYYDMFRDQLMCFGYGHGRGPGPQPALPEDRTHVEHRPLMMDWDVFWRVDPVATEKHIRSFGEHSVDGGYAGTSGAFDRHTSGMRGGSLYSFSESGGILVESLVWLNRKLGGAQPELLSLAKRVAKFTFDSRDEKTGLVPVQNSVDRWDRINATSEIGLWAQSMLNAHAMTGDLEYLRFAADSVRAYLDHAWDAQADRYFGKIHISTGNPDLTTGDNRPGAHADLWNAYFPDHEYGIVLGETCVRLFELTGSFAPAVFRLARNLIDTRPSGTAAKGHGAYAELYGRAISFLSRAGRSLSEPAFAEAAHQLADEAIATLHHARSGLFRGHAGEDRYDAVDGVSILGHALLNLDAPR